MSVRDELIAYKRSVLRAFGATPMCKVMDELRARGVEVDRMNALEPFGREGSWHTMDYAKQVSSLTAWEINPVMEKGLRKNLPNATCRITDAYKEIFDTDEKFDLIVVDCPMLPHGDSCEHFQFFTLAFRIARDPSVMILSFALQGDKGIKRMMPHYFGPRHLAERQRFYECRDPESVSEEELVEAYRCHTKAQGWEIAWWFTRRRDRLATYFVMKVKRPR